MIVGDILVGSPLRFCSATRPDQSEPELRGAALDEEACIRVKLTVLTPRGRWGAVRRRCKLVVTVGQEVQ